MITTKKAPQGNAMGANASRQLAVRTNAPVVDRPMGVYINMIINKTQSSRTCNLTHEELIVLALAASADNWLSKEEIGRFILSRIKYYQVHASKHFFGGKHGNEIWNLNYHINKYLESYDTPVYRKTNESGKRVYSVTAGSAYHYVNRYRQVHDISTGNLVPVDKSPFRFMDLPLEIRQMVYRLILKVSGYRIMVDKPFLRKHRQLRAYDERYPVWERPTNNLGLIMPSTSKLLALLLVSKEVKDETKPEFFSLNHFEFRCLGVLKGFLDADVSDRRKLVRQITVPWNSLSVAAASAKLLIQCDSLQKLTLLVEVTKDQATGHLTIGSSIRKFTSITQIPGFKALGGLRGIQLEFNPKLEHRVVKDYLRPLVSQPRVINDVKIEKTKKVKKAKNKSLLKAK